MEHKCNTLNGSSGGPILNLSKNKIIGIHKGRFQINKVVKHNLGTLLKYPLNDLKNKSNKNEINMKVEIKKEDINKKINFLSDSKATNINISNTELYINNIKKEFNIFFIPSKEGIYNIRLKFHFLIEDCSGFFYNCQNLKYIDLSSFDTRNVKNMGSMFYRCWNLENINLSSIVTKNLTNLTCMFYDCANLKSIDLSSFDTRNVTSLCEMFFGCYHLKSIDISSFDIKKVTNIRNIFGNCLELKKIKVNKESYDKFKDFLDNTYHIGKFYV